MVFQYGCMTAFEKALSSQEAFAWPWQKVVRLPAEVASAVKGQYLMEVELRGLTVVRGPVGGRGGRQLEPLDKGQLLTLGHGGVVRDGGPAGRGEGSSSPVTRIAHRIEKEMEITSQIRPFCFGLSYQHF